MSYIKDILVERTELAEALNVADKYINELVNDHGMPKVAHNQYKLLDCFRWFISYKDELNEREVQRARREKPSDLLTQTNAELKELQLEERRKNLVDINMVLDEWLTQLNIIVTKMDGFGIKIAPSLSGLSDIKEIRNIIDENIDKLKEQIANTPLDLNKRHKLES